MLRVSLAAAAPAGCAVAVPVRRRQVPALFADAAAADGFDGEADTVLDLLGGDARVLLVGLSTADDALSAEAAGVMAAAHALRERALAIDTRQLSREAAAACGLGACLRAWRTDAWRSVAPDDALRLEHLYLVTDDPGLAAVWTRQEAVVAGVAFARDLVTAPANYLTPAGFVDRLGLLVAAGVELQVIDAEQLQVQGFGGLDAVGRGSCHPPALAVLRWAGAPEQAGTPPMAFVGKGITFDTGGISIKPADHMWEMRADMAGAAACAGAMLTLARRNAPTPAIAVLALAENAVGAASYRPGDVISSLAGHTVEVVDTDAEGRLVLMDALAFAARERPAAIVDLATLTGSVVVALGHQMAGLYDNEPVPGSAVLAKAITAAGDAVGERVWRMPIAPGHRRAVDSDIADLRHCSPERGQPDASHAAAFLREFVGDVPWAHIDIAGVESREDADDRHAAGATGFGVRLLDRLMADRE